MGLAKKVFEGKAVLVIVHILSLVLALLMYVLPHRTIAMIVHSDLSLALSVVNIPRQKVKLSNEAVILSIDYSQSQEKSAFCFHCQY
jgi:hypothetical protein